MFSISVIPNVLSEDVFTFKRYDKTARFKNQD